MSEPVSPGGARDAARRATALRALAHPLRWQLIDLLGREQAATATRCAQVTGDSVASCSYHLGILAKYGYVAQAPGGRGREKPWQLTSFEQNLSGEGLGTEGARASGAATEAFLDHELARMKSWLRRYPQEPEEWRRATTLTGVSTALTLDELRELSAELRALAARYADRARDRASVPDGAREVRVFVSTLLATPPGDATPVGGDATPPGDAAPVGDAASSGDATLSGAPAPAGEA